MHGKFNGVAVLIYDEYYIVDELYNGTYWTAVLNRFMRNF